MTSAVTVQSVVRSRTAVAWVVSARVTAIVGWLGVAVASATIAAAPASTAPISSRTVAARVG